MPKSPFDSSSFHDRDLHHPDASAPSVLPLHDAHPALRGLVGGKAANLAHLLRSGFPVPDGFCVTTAAFGEFLAVCPNRARLAALWTRLAQDRDADVGAFSQSALAWLSETNMPTTLKTAVLNAWRQMGCDVAYAVRSSATVEDAREHSFAGQFESVLHVRGAEALLAAIESCWRSLFGPRAVAYLASRRLPQGHVAMAVLVQPMLPAETAGVLFTLDPVSGRDDRLVIEGARGLGDRLVSGRLDPERVVLDKVTLRILERHPADAAGCLEAALVQRLGELGARAERLFGRPQDIEWAAADGKVVLLQTRPLTAARPARSAEPGGGHGHLAYTRPGPPAIGRAMPSSAQDVSADGVATDRGSWAERQIWSNLNTGEVAPDVATPVTWSMMQRFLEWIAGSCCRVLGADVSRAPLIGRVGGRIYFNVNTALAVARPFRWLWRRIPNVGEALGGAHVALSPEALMRIPDEDLPDLGFRWPKYLLSLPRVAWDLITHSPSRGDAWTARLKTNNDTWHRLDFTAMPMSNLLQHFEAFLDAGFRGWDLLYLGTQAAALPVFHMACRRWLNDPHLTLGYRLFAALGDMPETEAGLSLWRLAVLAQANPETATALSAKDAWPAVRARLGTTPPGRAFLAAWESFMHEHGHHCRGELELFNPRWSETPDYILEIVRGYVQAIGQSNPVENQRRLARERQDLTDQCRRRLRNPLRRWIFLHSLRRAQKLAVNREAWKNQAVRHLTLLRRILLALGEHLARDSVLRRPDDLFFLELDEIRGLCAGRVPAGMQTVLDQRRRDYESDLRLRPPAVVFGRFESQSPAESEPGDLPRVLTGIPVFPGVVAGPARVILRTNHHEQVRPGEILVAPFTDPAWTPYFVTAAAVVMGQGGILSHGSIVARELGLPAVTNVTAATQLIRTGDWLEVNGNRGRVSILRRARNNDTPLDAAPAQSPVEPRLPNAK
ncbi:MAG: hypothetical protein JXQ71_13465 [Verrucomicrobia bacterium]|nr:hypothetical protein [Verrucomicrobiota bacterium]